MGKKNRRRKQPIPRAQLTPEGPIPEQQVPPDRVLWCLKYLDAKHQTFDIDNLPKDFGRILVERFRDYGRMPFGDFAPNKSIHSHRVDAELIEAHGGFSHVKEELWKERPWQFQLQNKMRIIGFLLRNLFHIVWIDVDHKFDSSK